MSEDDPARRLAIDLLFRLVEELAKKAAREDHDNELKRRGRPRKRLLKPRKCKKTEKVRDRNR